MQDTKFMLRLQDNYEYGENKTSQIITKLCTEMYQELRVVVFELWGFRSYLPCLSVFPEMSQLSMYLLKPPSHDSGLTAQEKAVGSPCAVQELLTGKALTPRSWENEDTEINKSARSNLCFTS